MKEIIKVCRYLAGINSSGMSALKEDFEQLTTEQIEKIDPFNANLWEFYGSPKKKRKYKNGIRFEGEKEGGEISLFDEVTK